MNQEEIEKVVEDILPSNASWGEAQARLRNALLRGDLVVGEKHKKLTEDRNWYDKALSIKAKELISEHFMLFTGSGCCYGIVPKNTKKTDLFYELAKKMSELSESEEKESHP